MMFWFVMLGFILGTAVGFAMACVLRVLDEGPQPEPPRPFGKTVTATASGPIAAGQMCYQLPDGTVGQFPSKLNGVIGSSELEKKLQFAWQSHVAGSLPPKGENSPMTLVQIAKELGPEFAIEYAKHEAST